MRPKLDEEEIQRARKFVQSLSPTERRKLAAQAAQLLFDVLVWLKENGSDKRKQRLCEHHSWIHLFMSVGVPEKCFSDHEEGK